MAQAWTVHDVRPLATASFAFDTHRGRGVMVIDSGAQIQVHEWDGVRWTPCMLGGPGPGLSAGTQRVVAYDPVRRHTVLMGRGEVLAWGWNGTAWTALTPPPFVPQWTTMAFDEGLQQVLVFDHLAAIGMNRTYAFDGTTWTLLATNVALPAFPSAMACDRARGRTVLRAGSTTAEWSGTAWVTQTTSVVPPASLPALYDPQRGKVIQPSATGTQWEWSGSDWVPFATPVATIGPIRPGFFCYDERRHELVLTDDFTGTTQVLGPGGWTVRQRLLGADYGLTLSADFARGQVLATGMPASPTANSLPTTRRWTAAGWAELGNLGLPLRFGAAQADRDLLGTVYRLAGSTYGATLTNELWAFDGAGWTLVAASGAPSARLGGALAVDVHRQRLVAFGGHDGTYWNDTREFDGTVWAPKFPAHAPSPRHSHAMCGSVALGKVFLYGGRTAPSGAASNEFWAWDGTDWSLLPSPPIGPVSWYSLADFPAAGCVVLMVGASSGQPNTWRWNGVAWSPLADSPFGTNVAGTEPASGGILTPLCGALLVADAATVVPFAGGCPGSLAEPTLRAFGRPWLGNPSFAFDLTTALSGATPALVGFGFIPNAVPLPGGCTAWFQPVASQFLVAVDGFATAPLPVPIEPALSGVQILVQGGVLDGAAPAGFALTAGLAARLAQ